MKKFILLSLMFLTACTYSVTIVHTQGEADNVVDENQSNEPDISPDLSFPVA